MELLMSRRVWAPVALVLLVLTGPVAAQISPKASVHGAVTDPLGGGIGGAAVTLLRDGTPTGDTTTAGDGTYAFENVTPGRYQVSARASGFDTSTSSPLFASAGHETTIDLTLTLGPLGESVIVTASAAPVEESESGAPVSVIDEALLDALTKPDLLEALRLVPGAQVHQTGARGGTTSLFIRGGNSSFAKVLFDGIPANDIGGGFDFSPLATTGVSRIEVLRQANSVVYGADALAGVVNIETRRGETRIPEARVSLDGGNLGTLRSAASLAGAAGRFDYFSEYSHFSTDNNLPHK
jgi:vitamin B12 transporter